MPNIALAKGARASTLAPTLSNTCSRLLLGIELALEKFSRAGTPHEFVGFHDHAAAREHGVGYAGDLYPFKHRIVDSHVMSLCADRVFALGIKNDQVGIAAHRDCSLARIQAHEFGRGRGNQFHKAVHTESALGDTAGINQAHAMLDPGPSVGNLGEIIASQFLLFLETEWAVVSGNHLQVIAFQSIPEFFLMPLLP